MNQIFENVRFSTGRIGRWAVVGLIAIIFVCFVASILEVRREGSRDYEMLRIGTDINTIKWPDSELVGFSCGTRIFTQKNQWEAAIRQPEQIPQECREISIIITGKVPYHAYWNIEFDSQWRIKKIGPLGFHES